MKIKWNGFFKDEERKTISIIFSVDGEDSNFKAEFDFWKNANKLQLFHEFKGEIRNKEIEKRVINYILYREKEDNKPYMLDVGVKIDRELKEIFSFCDTLNSLMKQDGGENQSSGAGFGVRDMQFLFPSRGHALRAQMDVRDEAEGSGINLDYASIYKSR